MGELAPCKSRSTATLCSCPIGRGGKDERGHSFRSSCAGARRGLRPKTMKSTSGHPYRTSFGVPIRQTIGPMASVLSRTVGAGLALCSFTSVPLVGGEREKSPSQKVSIRKSSAVRSKPAVVTARSTRLGDSFPGRPVSAGKASSPRVAARCRSQNPTECADAGAIQGNPASTQGKRISCAQAGDRIMGPRFD